MKEILETKDIEAETESVVEELDTEAGSEEIMDKSADKVANADDGTSGAADIDDVSEEAVDANDAADETVDTESADEIAEGDDTVDEAVEDDDTADDEVTADDVADEIADADDAADSVDDDVEGESDGPLDRVWKAIRMYRRDEVSTLMREHALDIATDEQKMEIGKGIMGLRDIKLVEQFAKEQNMFTPDMLRLDFENWNNRDFVRQVLSRCKKNFDLSDETVCRELFEISCEVGQTEVLSFLVNKKKAADCYPMLARGTEEAFAVLKQVKPASLDADMRVEIMYAAATTTQGQERLEKLSSFGYDLFEENSDEKELSDLLNERIAANTYTKNRAGDMNRIKDKSVVQFIERKKNPVDSKAGRKKFSIKKALPFLILGLVFICVLVYAIAYQIFS